MDKIEYELWRQFDIKGYAGAISIISLLEDPELVRGWRKKEVRDSVDTLIDVCLRLVKRIEGINKNCYDGRFPLAALDELKMKVAPALEEIATKAREAIETRTLAEAAAYVKERLDIMRSVSGQVRNHPGYSVYRDMTRVEDRIGY